jgi:hypothetical protein
VGELISCCWAGVRCLSRNTSGSTAAREFPATITLRHASEVRSGRAIRRPGDARGESDLVRPPESPGDEVSEQLGRELEWRGEWMRG